MLVGIAIPLKTDVVRLACVFVCYICFPAVEKGPNSNLSSLILLHLCIPLKGNEIFQRVKKLTDQRRSRKRERMNFHILSLKPSKVQASSWKNISTYFNYLIQRLRLMKADPQNFHLPSYPLKNWSIELDLCFHLVHQGPQKSVFQHQLKYDESVFFGCARAPHWSVLHLRVPRLRFAGASFLAWKLLKASRLRAKKRNFQAFHLVWSASSGLTPHKKSPQSFSKWPSATGFPSKTRKKTRSFTTLFDPFLSLEILRSLVQAEAHRDGTVALKSCEWHAWPLRNDMNDMSA